MRAPVVSPRDRAAMRRYYAERHQAAVRAAVEAWMAREQAAAKEDEAA